MVSSTTSNYGPRPPASCPPVRTPERPDGRTTSGRNGVLRKCAPGRGGSRPEQLLPRLEVARPVPETEAGRVSGGGGAAVVPVPARQGVDVHTELQGRRGGRDQP